MVGRLLFVVNSFQYFVSHRLPIAVAALEKGYEVHVASSDTVPDFLGEFGIQAHSINLIRGGVNPVSEARSVFELYQVFRRLEPALVHLVTTKPVLYGGIAARAARVPAVVYAVAGLGSIFLSSRGFDLLKPTVSAFYRHALAHSNSIAIFQNPSDKDTLSAMRALRQRQARLIPGSGVSLENYEYRPEPDGKPVVTMASRLVRDKGVSEFVEASKLLHARGVECEFRLIGEPDPRNPSTVDERELVQWREEGHVRVMGYRTDIAQQYAKSHIVCLPSYREGLPKSLVEAAACGRAVVTTDVPGCREAIIPGRSGILVPPRDPAALADAIETLIKHPEMRREMGRQGRGLAEREFAIEKIVDAHMSIYKELLSSS